jgi:DNA-binding transcriptional ArsR family regulator
VFELLRRTPASVGELAAQLPVSRPAVSQHLRALLDSGLVKFETKGTRHVYSIDPSGLVALRTWIDSFWDEALERYRDAFEREWGYRP